MTASLVVELPRILVWEYREKYMRHRHRYRHRNRETGTDDRGEGFVRLYLHTASLMAALALNCSLMPMPPSLPRSCLDEV